VAAIGSETVTAQVAVTFVPSLEVADITALPLTTPVTTPAELTVATEASLDDQVIEVSAAVAGVTVAVIVLVLSASTVRLVGFNEIAVTNLLSGLPAESVRFGSQADTKPNMARHAANNKENLPSFFIPCPPSYKSIFDTKISPCYVHPFLRYVSN
jgi:hypothetical protein